ncbi:MAG: hypothetical protein H7839_15765 [Magnetococcus sp. YQC-5]
MMRFSLLSAVTVFLCMPGSVRAASWYAAPFAADIVMINPEDAKDRATGKLFVGQDRFRAEGLYQGAKKVLIVNMAERKAFTLMPDKKEFHEGMSEALLPPRPDLERMPTDPQGPCKTDPHLACTKDGDETINGIQTEKWSVKATPKEGSKEMTYLVSLWIDPKRRIVIKQQPDKGPVMERKLLGVEKLDGRETEKWEFIHTYKDQRNTYQQWIDVALRIPVRMGEGRQSTMEVSNIREGMQESGLFQVPGDFKEIKPPPPPSVNPSEGQKSVPSAPGVEQKKPSYQ